MVSGILEQYAARGLFRGFSRGPVQGGRASFKMLWHRDRFFELVLDARKSTLSFRAVLPRVPAQSEMYRELQAFVAERQSEDVAEHRRIDPAKAAVRMGNRAGDVSVTLLPQDGDWDYVTRKLVNLVHEIYLVFLFDGRYYDYLVETFELDPDRM